MCVLTQPLKMLQYESFPKALKPHKWNIKNNYDYILSVAELESVTA